MQLRLVAGTVACLAALSVPASAVAPGVDVSAGQYSIGIVGFVPVICRANLDASVVTITPGAVQQLGALNEFCNSPNGYRVHADYSASLAKARLLVDGHPVPLHKDGSTVVSQSNRAAIASHDVALELPKNVTGGSIVFRIEPL